MKKKRGNQLRKIFTTGILILLLSTGLIPACSPEAKKSRLFDHAERYFNAGEYNKAKIEYLSLLRLDPQNATAFQRLGTIWFEQGAPLRAIPFLLKARELTPGSLSNRIQLAHVLLSLGDATAARKEVTTILGESPNNEEAIVLLAETDRTKEETAYTEQQLQKFHDRDKPSYYLASAAVAFHKGNLASAQSALQRAVELDPRSPTVHRALASFHLLAKDLARAGDELKIAAELSPPRSIAKVKFAEFKAQTGAVDEAKQILKQITSTTPDLLPAWILSGRIALADKHYAEASSLLENVFSQDPENIDARIVQSQVLLGQGETHKATEELERLSKAYPNAPGIKYQLALVYLQQNNSSQATDALKQAIALNPNYVEAILLLGQLNLRSGNPQAVVPAMTDLLKKRPGLTTAESLLAEAYQLTGRLDEAVAILQEQIRAAPQSPQSHFLLGLILRQQNKNDEARKAFEKARELAPNNLAATDQLVQLDIASKNLENAAKKAQEELNKAPNSAAAHFIQAKIYIARQALDEAEAALVKALDLDPNLSSAYNSLISVYIARGKLPEAIGRLEGLLAKNPKNVQALMTAAVIYEQTKSFEKARDAYEKLLETKSDFAPALNNLAYLYANRFKELDKAYDLAKKARQLQPADASVADTLGWILYQKADYPRALTLIQESAAKLSDVAEVQFHLGMANYMMGQTEPAKKALQRAATAKTDFPGKAECEHRLALLENSPEASSEVSVDQMKKLLEEQPNDPIALQRMGALYEKNAMFSDAATSYEQALKLNPSLLAVTTKLAELNAGPLKNNNKAMNFAKRARELAPTDPKIASLLGNIAYQIGNFDWAYSLLQESVRNRPDDVATRQTFAWTSYSLGKISEAQQTMQEVLKAASDPHQIEEAKSFLEMTALSQTPKDLTASEHEVERILQADPNNVPALMVKAELASQRNEKKSAADIYNKVLQRYPDFAPAQKQLASLYAGSDAADLDKAYDLAVKARKKLPEDADLTRILAEISYKKKDFAYALQLLSESARKKPLDAKALYYLGMSSLQLKQNAQARDALHRALEAGLQEPFSTEARQAISQLR